ncbi:MAG: NfeD family protein [Pontibacterium sp.]
MFDALTTWHWLILAVLMLILEMLGAAGFLLGISVAAFMLSALVALDVLPAWQHQLLWFSLLAVVFTLFYWKVFRRFNTHSEEPLLNNRAAQLVGRKLVLDAPLIGGQGRIKVGDTLWKAQADTDLEAGTQIEIFESEGMTLKVRSVT